MEREQVRQVVRTTLLLVERLSRRTRTQADDLMAGLLRANEDRLVDAVLALLAAGDDPPTDAQVVAALAQVGLQG